MQHTPFPRAIVEQSEKDRLDNSEGVYVSERTQMLAAECRLLMEYGYVPEQDSQWSEAA